MGGSAGRPNPRRRARRRAALLFGAAAIFTPVFAQQAEDVAGPDLRFRLSSGLATSDNLDREEDPPGQSTVLRTTGEVLFDTRTRREQFSLRAGADLEFGVYANDILEEDNAGLNNPFLQLDYARQSRRAEIGFTASYRETDVGVDVEEDFDGTDLIVDQGTRISTRFGADLTLGRDAPATYIAALRYDDRRFEDTEDPDLTDRTRLAFDQSLALDITRTTQVVFSLDYIEIDEDDEFDTFETNVDARIGLRYRARTGLTAQANIGYSRDETEVDLPDGSLTLTEEAPVFGFGVTQPWRGGTVGLDFDRTVSDAGARSRLTVSRAVELPRGAFSATAGLTIGDDDDEPRFIGGLSYTEDLRRGRLALNFSQEVGEDDDDDGEFLRSRFGIDYAHRLSRISQIALQMDLSATDEFGDEADDRQQLRAQVVFRRQLTEDWSFNTGYRHFNSRASDRDPIIENEIFANVSRTFVLLP
jgi:hypothetical protein